ncbi:MAG: hypothetical protein IKS28_03015 [Clostridia bacterium]|nr:hypothetical protein [Clostridia bacterium]
MAAGKFANLDFSPPPREYAPPPDQESSAAPEYSGLPEEYFPVSSAPVKTEKKLSSHEMLKKMFLAPVLGIITVLTVASSAFGTDLISSYFGDILGALGIGFPNLPNLEPNGYVSFMDYGILNEEYVMFETGRSEPIYMWAGTAYGSREEIIEGASYDRENNVLTLTDFHGEDVILNVNLMGNGFTVCLNGENTLGEILVWGFYYGGSLKFIGNGSLTVNKNSDYEFGIYLQAEYSESCLMIDSEVEYVDVYGSRAAFYVGRSSHQRGLYLDSGLSLSGGKTDQTSPDDEFQEEHHHDEFGYSLPKAYDYSIFENGEMSKHITVSH